MKITERNLKNYLITLQLIQANYEITYEEIIEMNEAKQHLDKSWRWYNGYSITSKQYDEWMVAARKLIKKIFKCSDMYALSWLLWFDLAEGLPLKV